MLYGTFPKYTSLHFLDDYEQKEELIRVRANINVAFQYLDQIPSSVLSSGQEIPIPFSLVKNSINNELKMVEYFLYAFSVVRGHRDEAVQGFVTQLQDMEILESLFMNYQSSGKNPYFKNLIHNLIAPYIPLIRTFLFKCKNLFLKEDTGMLLDLNNITGLNIEGQNEN